MRFLVGSIIPILLLPFFVTDASAQLRLDEARIENGRLVVRGSTQRPHQRVTLDRRFTRQSNSRGMFEFRVRHTPFLCRVTVRAAGEQESAKVDNCILDDRRRTPAAR